MRGWRAIGVLYKIHTARRGGEYVFYDSPGRGGLQEYKICAQLLNGEERCSKVVQLEKMPQADNQLEIYPNPTRNTLSVRTGGSCKLLIIYDQLGRSTYERKDLGEFSAHDITGLLPGSYTLVAYIEGRYVIAKRLIVAY
ncbi:MAG: T9SS type A sorting domain-containing protein [Bacteroidetes bacterium]|nr:T9SS type A sorting domain-containing protein [Bacteroidota bacterium]